MTEENYDPEREPSPSDIIYPELGKGMRLYGGASLAIYIISAGIGLIMGFVPAAALLGAGSVEELMDVLRTPIISALAVSIPCTVITWVFLGIFLYKINSTNQDLQNEKLKRIFVSLMLSFFSFGYYAHYRYGCSI
jgi:Na+-driven multidrug efflux pump